MVNPWVLLGVAVMWGLSLFAVGKWQRADGRSAARVEWQAKDNAALTKANKRIQQLNDAARATEQRHADEMALVANQLSKEKTANEAQRKRDAAAIRDGALSLRIATARICPGGSEAAPPSPTPARSDGPATVELPQQITGDLFELAHDADAVSDQLRACQSIVLNDRKGSP